MKIDLTAVLTQLNGEPMKDAADNMNPLLLGRAIAYEIGNNIDAGRSLGIAKAYVLMQKFFSEDSIELDDADAASVKKIFEGMSTYPPIISGQILKSLS